MLRLSLLITATERVTAPVRRVRAGIRAMVKDGVVDIRKLDGAMERLANRGARLTKIGAGMTLGLTAPLAAFSKKAFKTASDAAELQSKHDQVFGKMAGAMNRWAVATGDALGRSTQEIQRATSTFGIFFNQAASPAKAAKMSATFTKLALDLGSFHNVDTETAIEKLRAGLSGEAEPLKAFGVLMTEAAVKTKAMAMGLGAAGRELTEQEKMLARYAVILDSTKNAQGDLERTSGSTANQIKSSQAAYEELEVTVGTKLLPKLTPLIEKLGTLIDKFNTLPGPVQNVVLALGAVAMVSGPVLTVFGLLKIGAAAMIPQIIGFTAGLFGMAVAEGTAATAGYGLATALVAVGWPILAVIAGVALLAGLAYLLWKNWDKVSAFFKRTWENIKATFAAGVNAVWNVLPAWMRGILSGTAKFVVKLFGGGSQPNAPTQGQQAAAANGGRGVQMQGFPQKAAPQFGNGPPALLRRTSVESRAQVDVRLLLPPGVQARTTKMKGDRGTDVNVAARGWLNVA